MNIIDKIKVAGLTGRGGAEFPTAQKWQSVLNAKKANPKKPVYVVCNLSEGEPGVDKDMHIVEYFPEDVIIGMRAAIETFHADKAYIFVQSHNLKKVKSRLGPFIKRLPIVFFPEDRGYLAGEETALIETIEGNRTEPRLKPPYPTEKGLFGCPTLVNNLETFYCVSRILRGEYNSTRFISIRGDARNPGVFEMPCTATIEHILKKTKNVPRFGYFVQVGGGASGNILLPEELETTIKGAGSIMIYGTKKTDGRKLMKRWVEFFYRSNCGKCAPCREGVYRLREELGKAKPNWLILRAVLETMRDSSFCPLGKSVHEPMMSFMEKIGVK
ncbi:MAG: hypothetical protein NTW66_02515 [Candidatus Magasanikbacteria bacterium]|nr:hypothetical protein [Candidatus Magasanikbacteria bacterium]